MISARTPTVSLLYWTNTTILSPLPPSSSFAPPAFSPRPLPLTLSPPTSPSFPRSATFLNSAPPISSGGITSGFTATNAESRRIVPDDANGRPVMKLVYVVLESQYQAALVRNGGGEGGGAFLTGVSPTYLLKHA